MALVSGGRSSTLNPNAPIFVPAAVKQVEDFSPEWWELITTSPWFHEYWLSQRQETELFFDNAKQELYADDVANLLPDDIDFGIEEDLLNMDSQFQVSEQPSGNPKLVLGESDRMAWKSAGISDTKV